MPAGGDSSGAKSDPVSASKTLVSQQGASTVGLAALEKPDQVGSASKSTDGSKGAPQFSFGATPDSSGNAPKATFGVGFGGVTPGADGSGDAPKAAFGVGAGGSTDDTGPPNPFKSVPDSSKKEASGEKSPPPSEKSAPKFSFGASSSSNTDSAPSVVKADDKKGAAPLFSHK